MARMSSGFIGLKDLPGDQFTDIGNAEDPHLYFDNKIHVMLMATLSALPG